jgi:hypothetical protein
MKNYTGLINDFNLVDYLYKSKREDHAKILNAYFEVKENEIKDKIHACDDQNEIDHLIETERFLPRV